ERVPTIRTQSAVVVNITMVRTSLPHGEDYCSVRLNVHVQLVVEVNIFSVQVSNFVDCTTCCNCNCSCRDSTVCGETCTGLYLCRGACRIHVAIDDSPGSGLAGPVGTCRIVAESRARSLHGNCPANLGGS